MAIRRYHRGAIVNRQRIRDKQINQFKAGFEIEVFGEKSYCTEAVFLTGHF